MRNADSASLESNEEERPIGTITEIHGPVVVIKCDVLPPLRRGLLLADGGERIEHHELQKPYTPDQICDDAVPLRRGDGRAHS